MQCLYPDLVVQVLESFDDNDNKPLMGSRVTVLADSLWSNMAVVRAWFKNGGHVHSRFPDALKNNPEGVKKSVATCRSYRYGCEPQEWLAIAIIEDRHNLALSLTDSK